MEAFQCGICNKVSSAVKYICYDCRSLHLVNPDNVINNIVNIYGMKCILEVLVSRLRDDGDYESRLKEDLSKALINYNNRYNYQTT